MDDGTSGERACEGCGVLLDLRNVLGVCTGPTCADLRRRRRAERYAIPKPEPRHCEACGVPLRSDNLTGICGSSKKPTCVKARAEKRQQGLIVRPSTKPQEYCSHPGGCPKPVYGNGLCNMHWARVRRTGELGDAQPERIRISAGDVFGGWTALEDYSPEKQRILCRCVCGKERPVLGHRLVNGTSLSCGCVRPWNDAKEPYIRAGVVLGRLTVLEDVPCAGDSARVRCSCGSEKAVGSISLKFGRTRSCGCLKRELQSTHGLSGHPLFQTWRGVVSRTTNPNDPHYENYGGRGIKICERWLDAAAFLHDIDAALGPRPDAHTLDRIDVDGNYEIGNLRWADQKTQAKNKRSVKTLTRERNAAIAERDALAAKLEAAERRIAELEGCLF